MAIVISGNGIDMGNNPVSNASQIDGVVINENGDNVATTSNLVGFKNYIINGNFDIWQRGTSQTVSGYGSDDRWSNHNFGSTKTHSRVACTDTERALFNANYFSRTVVSSVAGTKNYVYKSQSIENITKLAGKTVTLSFWAKADSNKNIAISHAQAFGTGGAPSPTTTYHVSKIALTTSWQKFTLTFSIPSIVGKTLGTDGVHTSIQYITFWFEAGSNIVYTDNLGQQSGTFDIAQVQLEEGSVATPFEQRPYGLELSLCQRYFERSDTHHWATNLTDGAPPVLYSFNPIIRYAVVKRVRPTLNFNEVDGTLGVQIIGHHTAGFDFRNVNTNIAGSPDKYFTFTADAEL